MTMHSFLPRDYEAPKTSGGNYMKLMDGENKIRILSKPIFGWEDWDQKKPIRFAYHEKPAKPIDAKRPIKHFWAFVVWNYREEKIQILEITQANIRNSIEGLSNNEDWGAPFFYDLKIMKTGEKMETIYTVNPCPHKPLSEGIKKAFYDNRCYLEALFTGEDPFSPANTRYTPAGFDESSDSVDFDRADDENAVNPFDQLKTEIALDGLPLNNLFEYVMQKAAKQKVTVEKYIEAALNPNVLPQFKKAYAEEMAKSPNRKAS